MEAEESHLIEAASDRADRSLEAVERFLLNFGETILITCSSMTRDIIPHGQSRSLARREALQAAHREVEMLWVEVACIEEKDHELSNLRAMAESFESEATRLRSGHDEACSNTKCLHGERTQL